MSSCESIGMLSSGESSPSEKSSSSPYGKRYPLISGPARISKERRDMERLQAELVMEKADIRKEQAKEEMFSKRSEQKSAMSTNRTSDSSKWESRLIRSPFRVNLLAEEERIHEEYYIKQKEEETRKRTVTKKRDKAKSDIILKALSEFSDLEALRREKRAILDEEYRLRSLLALEKTNAGHKSDRDAARRALQQRHDAKLEYRRGVFRQTLADAMNEENMAYRRKHGLLPQSNTHIRTAGSP